MVPIEQKDGTSAAVETVDFPLPLPACCRACGKRKRLLAVGAVDDDAGWGRSGGGENIAGVRFDQGANGGHGAQPPIEGGRAAVKSPLAVGGWNRSRGPGGGG